jgi:hypothetical protein
MVVRFDVPSRARRPLVGDPPLRTPRGAKTLLRRTRENFEKRDGQMLRRNEAWSSCLVAAAVVSVAFCLGPARAAYGVCDPWGPLPPGAILGLIGIMSIRRQEAGS